MKAAISPIKCVSAQNINRIGVKRVALAIMFMIQKILVMPAQVFNDYNGLSVNFVIFSADAHIINMCTDSELKESLALQAESTDFLPSDVKYSNALYVSSFYSLHR